MKNHSSSSCHTFYSNLELASLQPSSDNDDIPMATLQVLLAEKSRLIDKLKRQVHNQKIQLEFYIKKEINSPLMVEFAKTCLPELTDENMALAMAMNKFYRELGIKSRIMDLHERVCHLAGKASNLIQTQEGIVGEITDAMKQHMKPSDLKKFLGNFDINTNFIEIFNSLLTSTLDLKRTMEGFKRSCDKLSAAEERRNEIVDHVYTLPQEERTICNYLLNVQMEKYELENLLKQISKKRNAVQPNIDEIDVIENNLKLLHKNFVTFTDEDDTECCVSKMLEKVYSQAMSLLLLSREQRDKYNKEAEQMKEENEKLREVIQHIENRNKQQRNSSDYSDVEKLHNIIRKTISEARRCEQHKTEELKQKSEECEQLKKKLSEVEMEKQQLQTLLDSENSDVNEVFASIVYKIPVDSSN